ncbi:hypothetical protein [Hydrocarboniclastica marina]|uniref:DUF3267 domain-containing protein n=1 Tax=Hydrocarboniclastica marina TaxID=2259620 RepID=A0A4P7XMR2_9ALTE|nr:hypothetical protein [Hydrocarboniclastica marina]QCF28044.1 hypothetical protein soil367_18395 [Hydrocarboniclastica marina]
MHTSVIDLLLVLSVPVLAGTLLAIANGLYYRALGRHQVKGLLITGLIGTPIHEISHALMALLFRMRINRIAFYKPDPGSNTLGYVDYSYYPARFSHKLGLIFVGLAPLIFGSYLVMGLFTIVGFPSLHSFTGFTDLTDLAAPAFWERVVDWARALVGSVDGVGMGSVLLLAVMIGTHATPSKTDLRGASGGALAVVTVLLGLSLLQEVLPALNQALGSYLRFGIYHVSTAIVQLALLSTLAGMLLAGGGLIIRFVFQRRVLPNSTGEIAQS